jgi:hypothetical protein
MSGRVKAAFSRLRFGAALLGAARISLEFLFTFPWHYDGPFMEQEHLMQLIDF